MCCDAGMFVYPASGRSARRRSAGYSCLQSCTGTGPTPCVMASTVATERSQQGHASVPAGISGRISRSRRSATSFTSALHVGCVLEAAVSSMADNMLRVAARSSSGRSSRLAIGLEPLATRALRAGGRLSSSPPRVRAACRVVRRVMPAGRVSQSQDQNSLSRNRTIISIFRHVDEISRTRAHRKGCAARSLIKIAAQIRGCANTL